MINKKFYKFILLCLCALFGSLTYAQVVTVSGHVRDEKGIPLPLVTIEEVGGNHKVLSDSTGAYTIQVSQSTKMLSFSYTGTKTITKPIIPGQTLDVMLIAEGSNLGQVVVIGYGSTQKSNISSSIAHLTAEDIKDIPAAGVDQMMQGKVPGVTINSNSGQPGGGVSVRVRGVTSVTGSNEPLYVIDGVPIMTSSSSTAQDQLGGVAGQTTQSPMATLNPNDIESIDILKDASAQAIYGSLGANGVVLITTKKGKSGQSKINYSGYYGLQEVQKKLPIMNLQQYATYYNSIVGEGTVNGLDSIDEFKNPSLLGQGTDWQDAVFQTGHVQSHQLSFSGGQNKTTYYVSGNYYDQTGTVIGSGFKRYAARANIDQQVRDWLKAGISTNLSKTKQRITLTDGQQSVISLMMYNSPASPVKGFDGSYNTTSTISGVPFGQTLNPVALALLRDVTSDQSKAFGNLYVEANFLKHFTFKNQFNYDFQLTQNHAFQPKINNGSGVMVIGPSKLREDRNNSYYWGLQDYLTYDNHLDKHYINVVAGHEASASYWDNTYITASDLQNNLQSISAGTLDESQTGNQKGEWAMESYFARANYAYDNRYTISASFRRDGSASFGPEKKWGSFKSISGAWTMTNEQFFKNIKNIEYLKLRLGYGEVGNQNTSGSSLYATNIRLIPTINGLFGQTSVAGVPANVGNPSLSWATVKTFNAGIDGTFFNRKIDLTFDYYRKTTTNMILPTVLPSFAGLDPNPPNNSYQEIEPPTTNAGEMLNTGIDIGLTTHNITNKDFTWKTSFVFSHYNNIVKALNSPSATLIGKSADFSPLTLTITKPGQPVGSFYGYVTDGIYKTEDELNNGPVTELGISQDGTWLGDIRYKDLDGNDTINANDQRIIGNPNPKFTYSITNNFRYKNFDLSIFLNGVYGSKVFNYSKRQTEALADKYQNQLTSALDRYTSNHTNTDIPRYNQWNNNNLKISDRYIESGSFLRIQNVTLGYNLPKKWMARMKFTNIRFYVTVQNLYTITKYSGYDPELGSFNGSILNTNIDYGHYPNPRTFNFGTNIDF